jgi:peptidoglycan/LPS O-acetylase OafA/YrhL
VVAAVVGVLSVISYRFVELPALQRKRAAPEPMPAAQVEAAP